MIVLTEKPLHNADFAQNNIEIVSFRSPAQLTAYARSEQIAAICGSRSSAIAAAELDFPSLKLFQLTSAGFDGVPCDAYQKKGIAVANAGSVYSAPIAETVILGMLLMAKKLRSNPNNRHFKLRRHYTLITELRGKKILILGAGNIGTAIASRLSGFEATVDGYDPFCPEKPQYAAILRSRDELLSALCDYDYIISTMPDNEQTAKFIDRELFERMKPTAVIVNVGRRNVFDQNALYTALKTKQIGGAVLDMFEKVPNPLTNPFRRLRNVIVLPGVAAISQEVNLRLQAHMTANVKAALSGDTISNVINGVR